MNTAPYQLHESLVGAHQTIPGTELLEPPSASPQTHRDLHTLFMQAIEQINRTRASLHLLAEAIQATGLVAVDPKEKLATAREERTLSSGQMEHCPRLTMLTSREVQVLKLISQGLRSKRIAQELGIAEKTVVSHRSHIMSKLNIHDCSSLVRFAIRAGLSKP